MKQVKKEKSGLGVMRVLSIVFAVCALFLGVANVVIMNNMSTTDYSEQCAVEDVYTDGESDLCELMTTQWGGTLYEIKLSEVIMLFTACAIFLFFGFSGRDR